MYATASMLRQLPAAEPFYEEEVGEFVPQDDGFSVEKSDGAYFLSGGLIQRLVESVNFSDEDSLNYFHRALRKWGVIDELRKAGAQEGDSVVIGEMEFDFVE